MRLRIEYNHVEQPRLDGPGVYKRPCTTRVTDLDTGVDLTSKLMAVDIHIGVDGTYANLTVVPEEVYVDGILAE